MPNSKPLSGKVALVTGASRGIGRGVALQLGEAGAIVYLTGRTVNPNSYVPGSLSATAKDVGRKLTCIEGLMTVYSVDNLLTGASVYRHLENVSGLVHVEARGGKAIVVACDHAKDTDIEKVFQQIISEQGRLDILVNNAFSAVGPLFEHYGKSFWNTPESIWDDINQVGLRSHYIAAVKAAKIMVPQKSGLMVNITAGHDHYFFNPAFGAGKAGLDKIAGHCAMELEPYNVTFFNLLPGAVRTETVLEKNDETKTRITRDVASLETLNLGFNAFVTKAITDEMMGKFGESPEFSGKCIVACYQDPQVLKKTGKTYTTAALGDEYHLLDIDGTKVTVH